MRDRRERVVKEPVYRTYWTKPEGGLRVGGRVSGVREGWVVEMETIVLEQQ